MPVPPKTSLARMTAKAVPSATCHSGIVGGRTSGMRNIVTRKPSLTSWRRRMAEPTSMAPPTAAVTTKTGKNQMAP
jgi:hypothetical protein